MAEDLNTHATATGVTIGVVRESVPGETRVGLIPDSVKHLIGKGTNVIVQSGAGEGSSISDAEFEAAGARIVATLADVHAHADVVVRVQSPAPERGELDGLKRDQILVSFLAPLVNHDMNRQLAGSGVTAMAVDAVPRITRAQSMDALSAMSTIAGYKAVLLAAEKLPKFFPLLMTAAGTIRPARVLVLGAGVAGLQAIATARRLGAVVEAYDARPVVKEQVESLGAKFVEIDTGASNAETTGGYAREATADELRKQQEGLNEHIAKADVVITTALVPGRPAPLLIPAIAVERMHHGSVIVDLAAETGGNCELTTPGEVTSEHGVTIIGTLNLPATLPVHASQMYAKVMTNFLDLLIKDGQVNLNFDDEIIANMAITNRGEIVQAQTRKMMGLDDVAPVPSEPAIAPEEMSGMDSETEIVEDAVSFHHAETESEIQQDDSERYPELTDEVLVGEEPDVAIESSDAGHAVVVDDHVPDSGSEHGLSADLPGGTDDEAADSAASADTDLYPAFSDAALAGQSPAANLDAPEDADTAVSDDGSSESGFNEKTAAAGFAEVADPGMTFEAESSGGHAEEHASMAGDTGETDVPVAADFDAADASLHENELQAAEANSSHDLELEDVYSTADFVDDTDEEDAATARVNQHADLEAFPGQSAFAAPSTTHGSAPQSASDEDDDDDDAVYGSHQPELGTVASARSSKLPKSGEGTEWVVGDGTANVRAGFPIKGNANSGLYHPHESPSYEKTIAEICFVSGEAAEKHGYRLPKGLEKVARDAAKHAEEESNSHG